MRITWTDLGAFRCVWFYQNLTGSWELKIWCCTGMRRHMVPIIKWASRTDWLINKCYSFKRNVSLFQTLVLITCGIIVPYICSLELALCPSSVQIISERCKLWSGKSIVLYQFRQYLYYQGLQRIYILVSIYHKLSLHYTTYLKKSHMHEKWGSSPESISRDAVTKRCRRWWLENYVSISRDDTLKTAAPSL